MTTLKYYHYPKQYKQLLANASQHEMRVLHDEGLYRHLRFQCPGTSIWHWDIITWPGSLAIRGDIGEGFIFTRDTDMLRFFDSGQPDGWINTSYWAEKLDRGSRSVREFSNERFIEWLRTSEEAEHLSNFDTDFENIYSIEEAIDLLDDNGITWDYDSVSSWEDYEYHFILALHAILWGAKKYHESHAESEEQA